MFYVIIFMLDKNNTKDRISQTTCVIVDGSVSMCMCTHVVTVLGKFAQICFLSPLLFVYPVYSWGRGEDGQLGLGDTNDQDRPVLVDALKCKGVVQVACGSGHTVVLSGESIEER